MSLPSGPLQIGDWLIEPELLHISKNGEVRKLEFRTMEILLFLIANRGEVVSKQQLHDEVWGEVFVSDNAVTKAVSKLRKYLDDDPVDPKYIVTISKAGYRFIAPVDVGAGSGIKDYSVRVSQSNRTWLYVGLLMIAVVGISQVNFSSTDVYSEFYDPVPVSTLVGPEIAHALSPDGKKLSFSYSEPGADNSDVYVKLLDDLSEIKFTDLPSHQGYGIWSPDGNYMAYASVEDSTCGIYKEPSFGGEKTRIGDCFSRPEDFVWSPDGKTIAFSDIPDQGGSRVIIFLDVESHTSTEVMNPGSDMSDRDPAFSPDGQHLFFRRMFDGNGGDIYRMGIADKEITQLTFDQSRILGLDLFDKGRQIAFSSNRRGPWALWRLEIPNGSISRLHINDRIPVEPRFSADGQRMVYKSIQDQVGFWASEKEGGGFKEPVRIAGSTRAEMHPSLSTDGEKLVYISNRSGNFEIWSTHLKDNHTTKLTSLGGSFVNMPSWSPKGTEVVFDNRTGEDNVIYILDVASKMKRTFIDLEGDQVNGRFSRDGKTIYFASNHTGEWRIWKKAVYDNIDSLTQVTPDGGYHVKEGYDDEYLYFTRTDTSGIWRTADSPDASATLFISDLSLLDWGSWAPVGEGIIYLGADRQVYLQDYKGQDEPVALYKPSMRVQLANPTLTTIRDRSMIILAQIEKSEDEIMMVDFKRSNANQLH